MQSYLWDGVYWVYAIDAACQTASFRPYAARSRRPTLLLPVNVFDMMMTLIADRGDEIMPDFFRKEIRPEAFLSRINTLYRYHLKGI